MHGDSRDGSNGDNAVEIRLGERRRLGRVDDGVIEDGARVRRDRALPCCCVGAVWLGLYITHIVSDLDHALCSIGLLDEPYHFQVSHVRLHHS